MTDLDKPRTPAAALRTGVTEAPPVLDIRSRTRAEVSLSREEVERLGLVTTTCPMCGLNPAGPTVKRKFEFVPPWVYLGLMANIVVLVVLYLVGRKRIDVDLALCEECASADKRAGRLRGFSFAGLILGPLLGALAGSPGGGQAVAIGAGAGVVAGIVGMVAAHLHTRHDVLACKRIDKHAIVLQGTAHVPEILEREAAHLLLGRGT